MAGGLDAADRAAAVPDRPSVDPTSIRNPPPEPLLSPRRIALTLLVIGLLALLVWAWRAAGSDDPSVARTGGDAVVAYDPAPGSRILRQAEVGVDLQEGYDGRLAINGVPIPEDQMAGAITPGTDAYGRLSPTEQARGPRPNNRNVVKFQPGPGKAIERFTTGEVQITVRYWRERLGPSTAQSFTYTVFVT